MLPVAVTEEKNGARSEYCIGVYGASCLGGGERRERQQVASSRADFGRHQLHDDVQFPGRELPNIVHRARECVVRHIHCPH